jgi:hypothetical protein
VQVSLSRWLLGIRAFGSSAAGGSTLAVNKPDSIGLPRPPATTASAPKQLPASVINSSDNTGRVAAVLLGGMSSNVAMMMLQGHLRVEHDRPVDIETAMAMSRNSVGPRAAVDQLLDHQPRVRFGRQLCCLTGGQSPWAAEKLVAPGESCNKA